MSMTACPEIKIKKSLLFRQLQPEAQECFRPYLFLGPAHPLQKFCQSFRTLCTNGQTKNDITSSMESGT